MLKRLGLVAMLCFLAAMMPKLARAQGGQYSTIVSAVSPLPNCTPAIDITQLQPILWDATVQAMKTCTSPNTWTILGGGGGGTIGGSITASHLVYASFINTASDLAGSAVAGATGAITLTAGADTTTPFTIDSHSTTQSSPMFIVNNQSAGGAGTGTLAAPLLVEGIGYGAFNPGSGTTMVAIQQDSQALANHALIITNRLAVGSASRTSTLQFDVPDNGISTISGGNAVGDGGGNYASITFDGNAAIYGGVNIPGIMGIAMIENPNAASQVAVTLGNINAANTGDLLDIVNSTGIVAHFDKSGGVQSTLFTCPEGAAPPGKVGFDIIYCDVTQHAMVEIPNNGAPIVIGGGGSGITIDTNGVANFNQTNLNLLNSAAFNGLTVTFTNTTLGNVQLGFSGTLGNGGLTNSSVSVNSQACTLGSSCTIPLLTNSVANASQIGINNITSTANAVGLTVTPINNGGTNQVRYEITGVVATALALNASGTDCSVGQPALGVNAGGNAVGCAAITDAEISFSNITTNNATPSQHGFAPKGDGSATDCYLGTSVFGACPTAVSAGSQYAVQYSSNGAGGFAGTTVPTVNGSYLCGYIVTTSSAVAPSCNLQGVPVDATNPATLLYSDRASYLNWTSGTALALPAVSGNIAINFPFVLRNSSTTLTMTPNAGAGDLINGLTSDTLLHLFAVFAYQDATTAPGHWFTIKFPTFEEFGATCTNGVTWSTTVGHGCLSAAPILSGGTAGGDLTGTYPNPTVAQIEGGVIPTSAHVGGWSAGKQPLTSSAHDISATILCSDTSGSGSAQSCTTAPSFTVSTDDCVTYTTTTANTGTSLTVALNSLGAKNIAIPSGSGWTTTLTVGIIAANKPIPMCYDGTSWDAMQTGTGSGGGGGGGSGAPNQSVAFTSATSATLTVANATAAITWNCYDNASPANAIYPSNVTVSSGFVVTFNFSVSQSGTCVVNSSGSGIYTASESGASWSITAATHLMGTVVSVTAYDSSGNQVYGDTVVDGSGNVTINWLVSQSGKVVITP